MDKFGDKWKDFRGSTESSQSKMNGKNPQSRNGGLLEDNQFDAYFAPKFDSFAKYMMKVRNQNKKEREGGLAGSLQGFDERFSHHDGSTRLQLRLLSSCEKSIGDNGSRLNQLWIELG